MIYFEIQADDIDRCLNFYTKVFNWTFLKVDDLGIDYYRISTIGINGAIIKRPIQLTPAQSANNAYICSIQVDNYDACSALILSEQGKIALAKFVVPNRCYQGYFVDTEGNTFGIFEVIVNPY
jgi:predicted enzyme related to lactoylglutathione lyase